MAFKTLDEAEAAVKVLQTQLSGLERSLKELHSWDKSATENSFASLKKRVERLEGMDPRIAQLKAVKK
jgi:hypothetical protein